MVVTLMRFYSDKKKKIYFFEKFLNYLVKFVFYVTIIVLIPIISNKSS